MKSKKSDVGVNFVEQDSLTTTAGKLVNAAVEIMRSASTEEDLRIGFEKALDPLLKGIGVQSVPKYEKSIFLGGRSDSIHGQVIIEYELPQAFKSKKAVDHAFDQLVGYIQGEAKEKKETLWLLDPKFVGVGFDGTQIFFVHYQGDKRKAKVQLDKKDFKLIGPYDFDQQSARTLLTYLRALSRKLLTAENLAEVYGPQSKLAPQVVSALVDAMENWSSSPRIATFFKEWKRLFGIVYGEQFATHQAIEAKHLIELYQVKADTEFQELLFCVHTYFVFLMKLIAAELLEISETSFKSSFSYDLAHSDKATLQQKLIDIEDGGVYAKRGITNFLEGDFFRWYLDSIGSPRLEEAVRDTARALSDFEPATAIIDPDSTRDLLKKLYQYLVPQEVRHKLGEYYTPDWLAELVMDEVGYDGNTTKRVLDPACGSGTFIVLAIKRAREFAKLHREKPVETFKRITNNIWGFDLNPLAIIASRTNYLFALGDLAQESDSFEIPIYLADSVLWRDKTGQIALGPDGESIEVPTSAEKFFVPRIWVRDKGFLMKLAAPLVEEMAKNQYTPEEAMARFRKKGLVYPPHGHIVQEFYKQVLKLEQDGRNGVWARFLKNSFAPMAAGRFDYVIGNPPWIRWGYLSQEYRKETLSLWQVYGLFSLKGQAASLGGGEKDFSMLFIYAAIDYYLHNGGKLGFLITQEVFKSKGAGEGFRRFQLGQEKKSIKFQVTKAHDLVSVQPFEGAANKTAAIFIKKGTETKYPLPYTVWTRKKGVGKIPTDTSYEEALQMLQKKKLQAKPMGKPTGSWQTVSKGQTYLESIEGANVYQSRRGASTEPYGVFWLSIKEVISENILLVENLVDLGKREIGKVEERIESDLVYPAVRGADIKRWCATPKIYVLISQDPAEMKPYPEAMMKKNWPYSFGYLTKFKDILLSRGSKTVRTLAERTEFYAMFGIGSYTVANYKVVWGRMANDIKAAVISEWKTPYGYKKIIPTDTTSLIAASSEDEAHYICAILNSNVVREFIKSYSSAGRGFGAPSVMNNVGISKYDEKEKLHKKLAELSKQLHNCKLNSMEEEVSALEKEVEKLVYQLFEIENR